MPCNILFWLCLEFKTNLDCWGIIFCGICLVELKKYFWKIGSQVKFPIRPDMFLEFPVEMNRMIGNLNISSFHTNLKKLNRIWDFESLYCWVPTCFQNPTGHVVIEDGFCWVIWKHEMMTNPSHEKSDNFQSGKIVVFLCNTWEKIVRVNKCWILIRRKLSVAIALWHYYILYLSHLSHLSFKSWFKNSKAESLSECFSKSCVEIDINPKNMLSNKC